MNESKEAPRTERLTLGFLPPGIEKAIAMAASEMGMTYNQFVLKALIGEIAAQHYGTKGEYRDVIGDWLKDLDPVFQTWRHRAGVRFPDDDDAVLSDPDFKERVLGDWLTTMEKDEAA